MKISVLGNVIATENIYQITPIKEYDCFDFFVNGEDDKSYKYGFIIKLFNKQEVCFGNNNKKSLEKLREEVIKYWSNNQSQIPKIEFE